MAKQIERDVECCANCEHWSFNRHDRYRAKSMVGVCAKSRKGMNLHDSITYATDMCELFNHVENSDPDDGRP